MKARLGELLDKISGYTAGTTKVLPVGIDKKQEAEKRLKTPTGGKTRVNLPTSVNKGRATDIFLIYDQPELWIAREILSNPGARTDLVPDETRSWENYLKEIGLRFVNSFTISSYLYLLDMKVLRECITGNTFENMGISTADRLLLEDKNSQAGLTFNEEMGITVGTKSHNTTLSDLNIKKDQSSRWQLLSPSPQGVRDSSNRDKESSTKGTSLSSLPVGINKSQSSRWQSISKLGELLEERNKHLAYEGLTSTGGRKPDLPDNVDKKQSLLATPEEVNVERGRGVSTFVPVDMNVLRECITSYTFENIGISTADKILLLEDKSKPDYLNEMEVYFFCIFIN